MYTRHLIVLAGAWLLPTVIARSACDVKALGSGKDDGPNIIAAFQSCKNNGLVNLAGKYSVNTLLLTTGLNDVEINLTGTLQYTSNITRWSSQVYNLTFQNVSTSWFLSGNNIKFYGGGTIDGNGQAWWDELAAGATLNRPTPFTIGNATNVAVQNIRMINAPNWFNIVYNSKNVSYTDITITTQSTSNNPPKNTDGWDIYRSDGVSIVNSNIQNGDDCVSLKPNSTNVYINNLKCDGSHGISIGSLGQYALQTDIVENVYVGNVNMSNAQNGARIKVWGGNASPTSVAGGGSGYVRNITFENFQNLNVDYPIVIDQCYATDADTCKKYPSKLSISDVHYIKVTGTSSGKKKQQVVDIECSQQCKSITAVGTSLRPPSGAATYTCKNVASAAQLDFPCSTSA